MSRRALLAALLALPACPDDLPAADPATTGSSSTTSTTSTTTPEPTDASTDAPTSAPSPTSTTTTGDPTTAATTLDPTTGAPPPECPSLKPCEACSCTDAGWACDCPPLAPEAGFIELEAVEFIVGEGPKAQARASSPTRIFYSFRPADDPRAGGPLFVLFNGGPGSSTGTLMAFGTGPTTLTPEPVANPGSWTALGDLLYIDARGTGFSYNLAADPSGLEARAAQFGIHNFNSYLDAADFVRVLLRFLAAHPQLAQREVVLVGESYGGVRATIMLALLLSFADYDSDGPGLYDDPALVAEVEAHLHARDPDVAEWTPARIAQYFPRQILIQPSLGDVQRTISGELFDLPGSPMFQLAAELGLKFTPCSEQGPECLPWQNAIQFVESSAGRSRYDLDAPTVWLANLFAAKKAALSHLPWLEAVLGVPPAQVALLPADQRAGGFRIGGLGTYPADGGTISELGELPAWDRYYLPFFAESNNAIRSPLADHVGIGAGDPHFGALFLHNLAYIDTFITAAGRDVAIYPPSIPLALATYKNLVTAVDVEPGEIHVHYVDDPFPGEPAPGSRTIRFPPYDASHAVSRDQPVALRDDVAAWLAGP